MAEAYISIEAAGRYEGIDYEAMKKRIQRNPNTFKVKVEDRVAGRSKTLVAVSSLSKNARQTYVESLALEGAGGSEDAFDVSDPPWYVEYDVLEYRSGYERHFQSGQEARETIEEYIAANQFHNGVFKKRFLMEHDLTERTFDRRLKDYRTASAWALYLERKTGQSRDYFKTLALARKPKERNLFKAYEVNFDGIPLDLKVVINQMWFETDRDIAANRRTVAKLQRRLESHCRANGITDIPGVKTLYRYIGHLNDHCNGRDAKYYLSNGQLAYRQNRVVRTGRNLKELGVMQILCADAHTFDLWVEYTQPNGKKTAIRPVLVAWIDVKSRMIFGDIICEYPNANTVAQSFFKAVYTADRTPERILLDNGKDFTAQRLTGQPRKFRLEMNDEATGVYKGMGVENITRALPYFPHIKAWVERFFGTVCQDFSKDFASYEGTLTGSLTSGKVHKDIRRMLEQGELCTMEEFTAIWSEWLEQYHCREHGGLRAQKEEFITPIEVFSNSPHVGRPVPPKEYAIQLSMNAKGVVVHQTGIRLMGQNYTAAELANFQKCRVNIYWDQEDVTQIYVYSEEHKFICMAYEQELLSLYPRVPQQALLDYWRMQKKQISNVRSSVEELLSLGDYIEAYETFSKKVYGTIDLIRSRQPKVITLPQDRRFREFSKLANPAKPGSTYLLSEGEKALAELELLEMG